ncbi:hypothetical protein VA602_12930 [Pseudomonas sp. MH2]|uniref:Histidine kinase-, DNA gyrase B-, and HSP90-like ATPase n=1 Tax=Pseudomonas machongensis TaxID=3110229 RepID=A0ABU5VFV3_9PSED|nr:hypothetical protein [Pseudomonas sp. MH2]MEA5672244.1 hypothetical protein [Pseudomonas sp. MH2]
MLNTGDHKEIFVACQHKFRGLVSAFKAKKFEKNRRYDHSFVFRRGYRDLMLEARAVLHTSSFSKYLQWCGFHIANQLPELKRYPTGYDELQGVSWKDSKVSLEREILWIAARINQDHATVNHFRVYAEKIEQFVLSGDHANAITLLKELESIHGASFWSVQLRIALEGIVGGLEGQKRYTSEVRSVYKSGLLNFIAYNTSVRNEDRVSIQKYTEDIQRRITDHSRYEDSVKSYMRHRLLNIWPAKIEEIADVLRVEQSHSLIDIYETFVSLVQHSTTSDTNKELRSTVIAALDQTLIVNDFRLSKACLSFGLAVNSSFPLRQTKTADALALGNSYSAIKSALLPKDLLRRKADAWEYIYSGVALSFGSKNIKGENLSDASHLIASVLRQDQNSSAAYSRLLKVTTNFSGLPFASAIRSFVGLLYRSFPAQEWRPETISLNCPSIGAEDKVDFDLKLDQSPSNILWGLLRNPNQDFGNLDGDAVKLFRCCGLLKSEDLEPVLHDIESLRESKPRLLPALTIPLYLHALHESGLRQAIIELIADECSREKCRIDLLPIASTLGSYSTDEYNRCSALLAPSIALHVLWEITEKNTTASHLRFKLGQVIRRKDVQEPAKLIDIMEKTALPIHQLVYFLKHVCTCSWVDQVRVVKTTSEILNQRQNTCSVLRSLDPEREDDYTDEIMEISNRQLMSDGQWIVDRTRVQVDIGALTRWATRELSEEFYRYRDLAKVVTPAEYDELMRDILIENQISTQFSEFDEADTVLYSLLVRIGHEFLNNSLFGLDYYLSKRIRHQSFVGLIRGPLELQNLITNKEKSGADYNINEELLEKFSDCPKDTLSKLSNTIERFSDSFDTAIIETKNKVIQIRSKDNPHGLISFELGPQIVPIARVVLSDADTETFIKGAVGIMWALLDRSLGEVREYISGELKSRVTVIFDEFRASLKSLVEGRSEYPEVDRTIGECSVAVQLALDDASSWFCRTSDKDSLKRTFDTDQAVRISIEAAKKCLRGFEPNISVITSSSDVAVLPSTLVFIHDVIFVSLDNARVHSGLKNPNIHVSVDPDLGNESFVIKIRCSAKSSTRIESEKKLSEIRENIERGEYHSKTKTEGGSGLYKIAAVVKQSTKGHFTFGFNDDEFEITVAYHFMGETLPIEEVL